jgi:hypothetical protein
MNLEPDCSVNTLIVFTENLLIDIFVQRFGTILRLVPVENHSGISTWVVVEVAVSAERAICDIINDISD